MLEAQREGDTEAQREETWTEIEIYKDSASCSRRLRRLRNKDESIETESELQTQRA